MFENILSFIDRHNSFILTTHDNPDADGLGSEIVMATILKKKGKRVRIINSSPIPKNLEFVEEGFEVEKWDSVRLKQEEYITYIEESAMLIMDTSEEHHLGAIREIIKRVKETFIIDHHEPKPHSRLMGFVDSTASSACELTIEIACEAGIELDPFSATAAYTGIVFDSGFFAYPKTTMRTFRAAMKTLEWGAMPNQIYKQLMENSAISAILLQKQAFQSLTFHREKKIAVMILYWNDFLTAGAAFEEVENIVNVPLKAKEIEMSILLREKENGEIFCSLRSKGKVNVSKIAQSFGGGGHVTAAGFRSFMGIEEIVNKLLDCVELPQDN